MAACPPGPHRESLREAAIVAFLPVARRIARRYSRADNGEDLYQVACVGLVKAVDRFDPQLGHAFLSYAVPTIDGEVKRHLRDQSWEIHVPRRLRDRHRRVLLAQDELRRAGEGRGCTVRDVQRITGISEEDILQALRAGQARNPLSIDEQRGPERDFTLTETLGEDDPALDRVTDLIALGPVIRTLPDRERRILGLYFFSSMTQREVAHAIGVSQMHVSRLLTRTCAFLRQSLLAG
jgi:RNA polymerase sigma-B factor